MARRPTYAPKLEETTDYRLFRETMRPVRKPKAILWMVERESDAESGWLWAMVIIGTQPKWDGWKVMPELFKIGVRSRQ